MKKFLIGLSVIIALCVSSLAQKTTAVDPCLSKDPKIQAMAKKPCPAAPAPKKNNPATPPKPTDEGETSDDNDKPSTKNKKTKKDEGDGSMFFITIEHNGQKTELANTQFESFGGQALIENEHSNRLRLTYGAGNSNQNNDSFQLQGMIPAAAKGTYLFGTDGVVFILNTSKFPNVPVFLCESGNYDITAMPLAGGFVEGTFSANCIGEIHDDGTSGKYTMSGRFKLIRMS